MHNKDISVYWKYEDDWLRRSNDHESCNIPRRGSKMNCKCSTRKALEIFRNSLLDRGFKEQQVRMPIESQRKHGIYINMWNENEKATKNSWKCNNSVRGRRHVHIFVVVVFRLTLFVVVFFIECLIKVETHSAVGYKTLLVFKQGLKCSREEVTRASLVCSLHSLFPSLFVAIPRRPADDSFTASMFPSFVVHRNSKTPCWRFFYS